MKKLLIILASVCAIMLCVSCADKEKLIYTYDEAAPLSDAFKIEFQTTGDTNHKYLILPHEVQDKLISVFNNPRTPQEVNEEFWQSRETSGFAVEYQGCRYDILMDGMIVAYPIEDKIYAFKNNALCDLVIMYAETEAGIKCFYQTEIKDITKATLTNNKTNKSWTIKDEDKLIFLEELLASAESEYGGSGCPFGEYTLKLKKSDGTELTLAMASDSCRAYTVNGRYFDYGRNQYPDNRVFYELFDDEALVKMIYGE